MFSGSLEAYLVIIAASIPSLRPILRRKNPTSAGTSSGSNKMNTWLSKQQRGTPRNVSNVLTTANDGPFFELQELASSEAETGRCKSEVYAAREKDRNDSGNRVPLDQKTIRKETVTEITFGDAASLETGALGDW